VATPTPDPSSPCATTFERRELREPYQKHSDQARYTLSTEELNGYLAAMGIAELCIPHELGAPFLNVDWDSDPGPADAGRMISLGFEGSYPGSGWSEVFILYATYDFAVGAMYDTYARPEDRDAVRNGTMPGAIEVDGAQGFVRFKPANFGFDRRAMYKTYVFPFETDYVAIVYDLGDFGADTDWDALIQDLSEGAYPYPPEQQRTIAWVDAMATSLRFQRSPQPARLPALPPEWRVTDAVLDDVTGDGAPEWVLLVWRPWQDWPIQRWSNAPSPIAGHRDAAGDSCHLILIDPRDGREIWAGSALPVPLSALSVEDVDGDGRNELRTVEGSYAGGARTHVDVWRWNGFGFTLQQRSLLGS
jgi:hypothetical protein